MCIPVTGGAARLPQALPARPATPAPTVPEVATPPNAEIPVPERIEPLPPAAEAVEQALQEARELQQDAGFDPALGSEAMQVAEAQLKQVQNTARQGAAGALGEVQEALKGLENQAQQLENKLSQLESMAELFSDNKLREVTSEVLQLADQGLQQYATVKGEVAELRQQMQRLSEEKREQLLGPLEQKLGELEQQLQAVQERLNAALPEEVRLDLPNMTAEVRLQHALGEISGQLSAAGAEGQASLETDTFKAYLQASTQTGVSGQLEVESGAFRALIEASSSKGVSGEVEIQTEALQMLVQAADGKVRGEAQLQLDQLKAQLEAGPNGASGRIEVNSEAFQAVLEASTSGFAQGRIEVQSDQFQAAVQAASDGSVSGKVEISTDSLRAVAEVAYKETLSARLGVETENLQVEIGSDGREVNWSVGASDQDFVLGLAGSNAQMSGMMRIGDVGIEIGWHDASVEPPEHMRERMEAMGGRPVESSMYGVMISYPF